MENTKEGVDAFIEQLHAENVSIIESMKAVMKTYGVSLKEAKQIVTSHPVWTEVVEAHQPFHEEAIRILNDYAENPEKYEDRS